MPSTLIQPSNSKRGNVDKLNPQQRTFVDCLLADKSFNPTEAAKAAGYKTPPQAANKLLKNVNVKKAIGQAIQERMDKFAITKERVLYELICIGLVNIQDLFDSNGSLIPVHKLPDRAARSISSVKLTYSTRRDEGVVEELKHVEIKFWDKVAALQLLGKHLGMFNDKLKVEHGVDPALDNLIGALLQKVEQNSSKVIDTSFIEHVEGSTNHE